MASQVIVYPATSPLRGSVPVPSDQELLLARMGLCALSRGRSSFSVKGESSGVATFRRLLAVLGVQTTLEGETLTVMGAHLGRFTPPREVLDLRGEAHVGALALGLLVSQTFPSEILVDEVVAELLVPALSQSHSLEVEDAGGGGARVFLPARPSEARAPGLDVATHGVFAWVKQAILLAGLRAGTETIVEERLASADHLERAMTRARMPLDVQGTVASLHPPRDEDSVAPQIYEALGSPGLAAPLFCAAMMVPGSEVVIRDLCLNPTRSDLFSVIRLFGSTMGVTPAGDRQNEPFGSASVKWAPLSQVRLGGETAIRLGDGVIPFFAVAAVAEGTSQFADLVAHGRGGDRRIYGRALGILRSAGVQAKEEGGVVSVSGKQGPLRTLTITTGGDGRLALLASLLALRAEEPSTIDDVDCLRADFPRWVGTLRALGAKVEVRCDD